ncbi:MAG: hypothetical protein CML03_01590 [Pseudooceanicola sp.]|nr:hypothetical protein [Pseudooceanicola sp.]
MVASAISARHKYVAVGGVSCTALAISFSFIWAAGGARELCQISRAEVKAEVPASHAPITRHHTATVNVPSGDEL